MNGEPEAVWVLTPMRVGLGRRRKPSFEQQKWLAGWLAHHISGSPHPFVGYIIGILGNYWRCVLYYEFPY